MTPEEMEVRERELRALLPSVHSIDELRAVNPTLCNWAQRSANHLLDPIRQKKRIAGKYTPELLKKRKREVAILAAEYNSVKLFSEAHHAEYLFCRHYANDILSEIADRGHAIKQSEEYKMAYRKNYDYQYGQMLKKRRLSTREAKYGSDPIYQLSHHAPTDRVWTNQQKLELFSHFTHYSEVCTLLGKTIEELGSHFFSVANNVEGFTTPSNEILAQREQRRQEREEHKRQAEAERQALAQRRQAAIDYCRQPGATRNEFRKLFPTDWDSRNHNPELFALLEQLPQQTTEDVMQQTQYVEHQPRETFRPDFDFLNSLPKRTEDHPMKRWTEENMSAIISQHRNPAHLRQTDRGAYNAAYRRYRHLFHLFTDYRSQSDLAEKRRLWTLDYCIERCKPFLTVKESKAAQPDLESWIYHHGWATACHAHMKGAVSKPKGNRYHTAYHIIQQCRTEEEFRTQYPEQYEYALTVKTLREAMQMHFPNVQRIERHDCESVRHWQERHPLFLREDGQGGIYRCIYACEFPDGHAYVGLTDNPDRRRREHGWKNHIGDSAVAAYKFQTGQQFQFKILTDFMPEEESKLAEYEWELQYEQDGWKMLNRCATGSVGSSPRMSEAKANFRQEENNLSKSVQNIWRFAKKCVPLHPETTKQT